MRATAALVIVVLATVCASSTARADDARPSVAVLYFDNNTGDASWDPLRKGLADMLVTDLSSVPALRVVERARLEEVVREIDLQQSQYVDPETAGRIGRLAGARYLVTGAIAAIDPQIRIDVRVIRTEDGEVVLGDKVMGHRDRFFELEQTLATRFAEALGTKLDAPATGTVDDIGTVLAYSRGLEAADRGDLEGASKQLAKVVTAAPKFKLAQKRYEDVLRRLMAAKKQREEGLSAADEGLLKKADAELAKADPKKAREKAMQRHVGYRTLRGSLLLGRIRALLGEEVSALEPRQVPESARAAVLGLIDQFVANQRALVDELATLRSRKQRRPALFPSIDADDVKKARELDLGSRSYAIAFASPQSVSRMLAEFLCLGTPGLFSPVRFTMGPTPAGLDARWEAEATRLLDEAIADIAAHETTHRERETVRALTLYGECLLARDRKMEAIARWQSVLDTYPTNPDFGAVEKRIREALGAE